MAGRLDSGLRRWVQNPRKILSPYLREGMTAVDVGCGPGFFTLDMASLVGPAGRVIAVDLQQGMLDLAAAKLRAVGLEERVRMHLCETTRIGLEEKADFILAFYMAHEVPDKEAFFAQMASILSPDGRMLLVEPPVHVSWKTFDKELAAARAAGLIVLARPRLVMSKTALLGHA
jgi:ubiquinone/menaquinone biosynthesis C-methylase UbiE